MFVGGVWALGEIGDRQAVPPLIQALGDGNSDVRGRRVRRWVR
jgi:HEAT repeat protein